MPGWLKAHLRRPAFAVATALLLATSYALRRLPPRLRYLPADAVTVPLARIWRRRALVERNFACILDLPAGDPRVRAVARRSVRNFGRMAIDFLASCTMSQAEVWSWVTPVGVSYLEEATAAGHGVIFAMPHLGSWDIGGAYAAAYGFPVTVVVEGDFLARLVAGGRRYQSGGVTLAPRDRSLRALFVALARNDGVVLLSDIAPGSVQTIAVPFFGQPAPIPTGPARLALRTGAPIMVLGCVRLVTGYRLEALAPLWPDRQLPETEAVCALTTGLAGGFEQLIARYPEHWYPFHPIWATPAPNRSSASPITHSTPIVASPPDPPHRTRRQIGPPPTK